MIHTRIIVVKNPDEMGVKAADQFEAMIQSKPACVIGLATGSTPIGTYKNLIEWYKSGDLDFSRVKSVNLDEYVGLEPTHDQSYRYFMQTNLFDHINIDPANTNVPNGMAEDPEAACAQRRRAGIHRQQLAPDALGVLARLAGALEELAGA